MITIDLYIQAEGSRCDSWYMEDIQTQRKNMAHDRLQVSPISSPPDSFCIWCLKYNQLHKLATNILRTTISHRDFKPILDMMVKDSELERIEHTNPRLNFKSIYYLQTQKGKKGHRLKIHQDVLGLTEKAYLLLLLYCTFGEVPVLPIDYGRNVLENEERLDQFLSEMHLCRKDFEVERVDFNADQYRIIKMVEPRQKVRILRIEYLHGSKELEGRYEYRYVLPGISIRQFLRGIKGGQALEYITQSMTQSEAEECFELLLKEGLITIVIRYRGEPRYYIANEDLREGLKSCWLLCGTAEMAMSFIWKNARIPTVEERRWLEMLRGKQWAMIYLNKCYEKIKAREKDKKKKGYHRIPSEVESSVSALYGRISVYFQEINKKYEVVSKELTPPLDVLIKMVYPEFLRNLVAKNKI